VSAIPLPGSPLGARLVINEMVKGLQLAWRRRALLLTYVVLNAVTFLGVRLLIGGGHLVIPMLAATLPALLALTVAQTAAQQGSGGIAEEINAGTLAQTQLTPASPQLQLTGRLAAIAAEALVAALPLALIFTLGYGLHYQLHPDVLVPTVLTVADGLGYALLIAALTVRVASIGAITHVFGMAIQLFAGTLVPVTVYPHAVETVARLLPTTLGVQALNTMLTGHSLAAAWGDGTLGWLLAHAAASLTLGWLVYTRNIRHARREGGL